MLDEDLFELRKRVHNLVIMNRKVRGLDSDCFSVDREAAGRLAARALLANGHRALAVMHSLRHGQDVQDRLRGFKLELKLHVLGLAEEFIIDGLLNFTNGWSKAGVIAGMAHRSFTALFCVTDVLAMATISRLQLAGIRIPTDLSILGYDDAELSAYTSPPLSTVRIPSTQVAANDAATASTDVMAPNSRLSAASSRKLSGAIPWRQACIHRCRMQARPSASHSDPPSPRPAPTSSTP